MTMYVKQYIVMNELFLVSIDGVLQQSINVWILLWNAVIKNSSFFEGREACC